MKKLLIIAALFAIKAAPATAQTLFMYNQSACGTVTFNVVATGTQTDCGTKAVSQSYGSFSGMSSAEHISNFDALGLGPLYWNTGGTLGGSAPAWVLCQASLSSGGSGGVVGSTASWASSCGGGSLTHSTVIGVGSSTCPSGVTMDWNENTMTGDVMVVLH